MGVAGGSRRPNILPININTVEPTNAEPNNTTRIRLRAFCFTFQPQ